MNLLATTDRRRDRADDLAAYFGELTTITPPTNADRKARWYVKAARVDGLLHSGPLPQRNPAPPLVGLPGGRPVKAADYSDEPEYDHPDYLVDYG